jgi:hypothetical protein
VPDGAPARTGLLATTDNVPGALVGLLAPLAEHGLNLSALESRPTGEPWTYRFFLEVEHPAGRAGARRRAPRAARRRARAARARHLAPRAGRARAPCEARDAAWTVATLEEVRDVVLA